VIDLGEREYIMLPNYIIDILKHEQIEKEKELFDELYIECPNPEINDTENSSEKKHPSNRGVAIIDFSV